MRGKNDDNPSLEDFLVVVRSNQLLNTASDRTDLN